MQPLRRPFHQANNLGIVKAKVASKLRKVAEIKFRFDRDGHGDCC
jgi:hypothetical protein